MASLSTWVLKLVGWHMRHEALGADALFVQNHGLFEIFLLLKLQTWAPLWTLGCRRERSKIKNRDSWKFFWVVSLSQLLEVSDFMIYLQTKVRQKQSQCDWVSHGRRPKAPLQISQTLPLGRLYGRDFEGRRFHDQKQLPSRRLWNIYVLVIYKTYDYRLITTDYYTGTATFKKYYGSYPLYSLYAYICISQFRLMLLQPRSVCK